MADPEAALEKVEGLLEQIRDGHSVSIAQLLAKEALEALRDV